MKNLKEKFIWQMTGEELIYLLQSEDLKKPLVISSLNSSKRYVYGIVGIAKLFGYSMPTANRIKKSGRIDRAITQIGRKIIVDAELALELAGHKTGGRK
ncbi:DUF3853 family protein [Capnocytophaga cynodegmi]|uniref:DUF3853 family protein n=1 Tax=Capnocytophaga cynodegmi TaxID=28189 RepID=UPI001EE2340E|nr:DUF3853 family protein [Capnocytophaga cynodegmi]GJQ07820.1 hypothetical protein CAPN010_19780 [Capnocytophaga cynodegmi]